ncbi:MAG TPA: tyrosine-type recombinase/integrase [Streptosporangiaceae bacterium]|nr:tyrosine-type recombinase/integrase [Streptosporangiaceae bacterium]
MQGSIYPHCACRDPQTRKPYKRGKRRNPATGRDEYWSDCPQWADRGHKKWGFVVSIRKTGPGKWEQLRRQGLRTRAEAEAALAKEVGDVRAGMTRSLADRRITVAEWAPAWLAGKVKLKPSTREGYRLIIASYIKPALGRIPLAELRAEHIESMLGRIRSGELRPVINRRGPDGRVSARTVNHVFAVVRAMLNTAVKRRMITYNPCVGIELESPEATEANVWTKEQVEAFLAYAEQHEPRLAIAFRLALRLAMRRGEISALPDDEIVDGALYVRHNAVQVGATVVTGRPKSRAGDRMIPLAADPGLPAALKRNRTRQRADRLAAGDRWHDTGLVVTDELGAQPPPWRLSERFRVLATAAGLPVIKLHEARHTANTIWRDAGVPVTVRQRWMGHEDPSLTDGDYLHTSRETHDTEAAKVARHLTAV